MGAVYLFPFAIVPVALACWGAICLLRSSRYPQRRLRNAAFVLVPTAFSLFWLVTDNPLPFLLLGLCVVLLAPFWVLFVFLERTSQSRVEASLRQSQTRGHT